jgi:endothelin-converting enzyme/putative endopeptidase
MTRGDACREQIVIDPHSSVRYRINGVVRTVDAWYEVFDVTELAKENRVSLW